MVSDPCENGTWEHPYDAIQEAMDATIEGSTTVSWSWTVCIRAMGIGILISRARGLY